MQQLAFMKKMRETVFPCMLSVRVIMSRMTADDDVLTLIFAAAVGTSGDAQRRKLQGEGPQHHSR